MMKGGELKKMRTALGWTQAELAKKIGYKRLSVINWENDKREIPLSVQHFIEKSYEESKNVTLEVVGKESWSEMLINKFLSEVDPKIKAAIEAAIKDQVDEKIENMNVTNLEMYKSQLKMKKEISELKKQLGLLRKAN